MAAPKKPASPSFSITVTLDETLLGTIENISNALTRIADSMSGTETTISTPAIPATTEEAIAGLKAQYDTGTPVTNLTAPVQEAPQPAQAPVINPPVQETPQAPIQSPLQIPQGYVPPAVQQAPIVRQAPVVQQMPPLTMPAMQAPAQPVPTTVPTYSLGQLMQACAQLMDKGAPPYDLFQKYGIQMLTELNPENYGLFATDLRAKGAQI